MEQTGIHGNIGIPQAAGDAQSSFFVVFQVLIQHKAAGGRIKDIAFFCAILARDGFGQAEILPRHVVGSDAVAENNAFFSQFKKGAAAHAQQAEIIRKEIKQHKKGHGAKKEFPPS